jgi:crotonobetainyl-CoA:carnitine CoA-transferase CaiB-like acyl-CoA transferase
MASEQEFWKNFCEGVGRPDLFESHPGSKYADHAIGDKDLQRELQTIFLTRTSDEWLAFGGEVNTPIAPVNTPATIGNDPQFADRLGWLPRERLGAEQLPVPLKIVEGAEVPVPTKAPTVGEHSDEVLRDVLGYDDARITKLRESGALG